MCRTHFLVEPDDGHVLWRRWDATEVCGQRVSDKGNANLEGGGVPVNPYRSVVALVGNQAPHLVSRLQRAEITNLPVPINVSGGVHLDVLTLLIRHPANAHRVALVVWPPGHPPEFVDAIAFHAGTLIKARLRELIVSPPNSSDGGEH